MTGCQVKKLMVFMFERERACALYLYVCVLRRRGWHEQGRSVEAVNERKEAVNVEARSRRMAGRLTTDLWLIMNVLRRVSRVTVLTSLFDPAAVMDVSSSELHVCKK